MKPYLKYTLTALGAVWAIALLVLFYQFSENGRYQLRPGQGTLVIDTRTGAVYHKNQMTQQLELSAAAPTQ